MSKWNEVTEERYDEMLGCLPPRLMSGHGFLVGEPFTHRTCTVSGNVLPDWAAFVHVNGRYFEGPNMTVPEWRALNPMTVLAP